LSTQVLTPQGTFQAWTRFLRAHAAITRQLSARLESEHGLTLSDFDVLAQLYLAPERTLRRIDLARQVLLTASGITRLLDGLERAGWVAKARCDVQATHLADVEELFGARLSDDERGRLAELLGKLPLADTACDS
jgi:MarR family